MSSQHYLLGNKGAHVYTGNQFQCELCKRTYKSFKTLTNHKCSYCPTCKKIFSTYQKFQIHKTSTCRYNELHTYETKPENFPISVPEQATIESIVSKAKDIQVRCTVKDVASLVGDGTTDITDDVVCSALELMRENFAQSGVEFIGYYTPAEMKLILTTKDKTLQKPVVPNDQRCINIHHIAGHWLTSYQQPNQGINVFDSLMSQRHFVDVLPQLQIIYGEDCVTRVQYPAVTQQSTQPICGIMAIAFAFSCFLDIDCTQINFDISVAASHLRKCLSMKKVSLFPVQSTDLLMSSADSYMANQVCQKEQNRIHQKQHREMSLSSDEAIRLQREKDKIRQQKKRKNLNDAEKQQQQMLNTKQHQNRRKRLDETQKQLNRQKDKRQHQMTRNSLDESQKQQQREKNKRQQLQGRRTLDESQKQQQRDKNKRQHSQRRSTLDESQKKVKREKDKKQHQVSRNLFDESQKQQQREKNKRQHCQRRSTLDESQKQQQKEKDKRQHSQRRSTLDESQKKVKREKDKKQHQVSRNSLNESQKQQQREKNKRQRSQRRNTLDESQKKVKREKDKKQHQVSRNSLNESQKRQQREKNKRQHNQRRNTLNESQKQKQQEKDRRQHREKRSDLTIQTAIENFHSVITKGPDCCCVSCKRLL